MTDRPKMNGVEDYQYIEKVGEGTYGVVYKARDAASGRIVALKKIRFENEDDGVPATALREVALLLDLHHPNIVKLEQVTYLTKQLYLVFEFLDQDLKAYMDARKSAPLPEDLTRSFTCQLLRALEFCHTHRVLHRDLKPQNILIDAHNNLKLADFGLARAFNLPMRVYTHEVVTLWYRPPEILLGSKNYSFGVDIWSAGCIFLEMMVGKAVFPGDSEIDQLFKIFQIRGTPDRHVWRNIEDLPDFAVEFPKWRPRPLQALVPDAPVYSLHLVENMLAYDPNLRYTARFALNHPFFDGVKILLVLAGAWFTAHRARSLWLEANAYQHAIAAEPVVAHSANASMTSLSEEEDEIKAFHFVQISDLHISRYNARGGHLHFLDFLKSALPILDPKAVFVTGDLTDAKDRQKLRSSQYPDEWQAYHAALAAAHLLPSDRPGFWWDLRGNHDAFDVRDWSSTTNLYADHSATRGAGFSLHLTLPFGNYLFLGLDGVPRRGMSRPFNFFGVFERDDLDAVETAYAAHPNANHTFWFAHYPLGTVHATAVSSRGNSIDTLARRATAYMCGHLHRFKWGLGDGGMYGVQRPSGMLELELADVKHHSAMRVVVVDRDVVAFTDTEVRGPGGGVVPMDATDDDVGAQTRATYAAHPRTPQPPVVVVTHPKDARFVVAHREPAAERRVRADRPMRFFVWTEHADPAAALRVSVSVNGVPVPSAPIFRGKPGGMPLWTCAWPASLFASPDPASPVLVHTLRVAVTDTRTNLTSVRTSRFRLDGRRIALDSRSPGQWIIATDFDSLILAAFLVAYLPLCAVLIATKVQTLAMPPAGYAAWYARVARQLVADDARAVAGLASPLVAPFASAWWAVRAGWLRQCEVARRPSVWYPLAAATAMLATAPLLVGDFLPRSPGSASATHALYFAGMYLEDSWHPVADAWLFGTFKVWQVYVPFAMFTGFAAVPPAHLYAAGNVRRERPIHAWRVVRVAVVVIAAFHAYNWAMLGVFYGWTAPVRSPLAGAYAWMAWTLWRVMARKWRPGPPLASVVVVGRDE
ncbi:hypothetical protein H9P43_004868 [Blastocladiella emersonii ATCC 22665]|nr:hypothetical protein H9P43_004868 [Blastocladiella emersonii ATCC 22665]